MQAKLVPLHSIIWIDPVQIEPPIAWAGFAAVQKTHHEVVAAFETEENELSKMEECAVYSLKQVFFSS